MNTTEFHVDFAVIEGSPIDEVAFKNVIEKSKGISANNSNALCLAVKRFFDIVLSSLGCVILSPLFLILMLIVKLSDGGKVFYRHERLGKNGKRIYIYKFRSMRQNSDNELTDEQLGILKKEFKLHDDPRVTKVGAFLRRTSMDELPQLINIIKGDLSITGPRPIVFDELNFYGKDAAEFLSVKPGLTGYWQAYARNNVTYSTGKRQKMELYYIRHRSLWFEIKILFKTVISVFTKKSN